MGVHGDIGATGLVPNMTRVLYLTDGGEGVGGQTFFPDAGVAVAPRRGAVLSFVNVDAATGAPDPAARHGVGAVNAAARGDRLVVQVPVLHRAGAARGVAYAEHVSGAKHKVHMGLMGHHGGAAVWPWRAHPPQRGTAILGVWVDTSGGGVGTTARRPPPSPLCVSHTDI